MLVNICEIARNGQFLVGTLSESGQQWILDEPQMNHWVIHTDHPYH